MSDDRNTVCRQEHMTFNGKKTFLSSLERPQSTFLSLCVGVRIVEAFRSQNKVQKITTYKSLFGDTRNNGVVEAI